MLSGKNREQQIFFPTHKGNISDKKTLKEKLFWGFHARDDYSADRQQLATPGFLMRTP